MQATCLEEVLVLLLLVVAGLLGRGGRAVGAVDEELGAVEPVGLRGQPVELVPVELGGAALVLLLRVRRHAVVLAEKRVLQK